MPDLFADGPSGAPTRVPDAIIPRAPWGETPTFRDAGMTPAEFERMRRRWDDRDDLVHALERARVRRRDNVVLGVLLMLVGATAAVLAEAMLGVAR